LIDLIDHASNISSAMAQPSQHAGKRSGDVQMEVLLVSVHPQRLPCTQAARHFSKPFSVSQTIFQMEDYLRLLDPLVERLNASLSGFKYDRKGLATLIGGLQQFLETAFGVKALQKPFPKLPSKLLLDLSPEGPVAIIARLCADFMKDKAIKRIDWTKTEFRRDLLNVLSRIRQELIRAGHLRAPRVLILPACPNEVKLRHAVAKLGGQVVPQADAATATHVLHPFGPSGDPDDGQEYLRTLEIRGGMARVHWWYLPDSYDEWIPALSAPGDPEPDLKPPGGRPWRVYFRWVVDSEKYNEWMNEVDYETEDAAAENKRAREAGEGEEAEAGAEGAEREKKRSRRAAAAAAEVAPGYKRVLGPGAVVREVVIPSKRVIEGGHTAIELSQGQRQEGMGVPVAAMLPPAIAITPAEYCLPAHALWFSPDRIGERERTEFPEFLASTPSQTEQYLRIRNALVARFREDPGRQLTFADALRGLDGDVNAIRKVFDFLNLWGIVNYAGPERHLRAAVEGCGNPLAGVGAAMRFRRHPAPSEGAEAAAQGPRAPARPGAFRRAAPQAPAVATGRRFFCAAHPGEDVTALRYHCLRVQDVDLCQLAFNEGRYPPGCCAKDFVLVTAEDGIPGPNDWSDADVLLLLEGQERFGNDWQAVAEHLGGGRIDRKSPMDCMVAFSQLPIEESLLQSFAAEAGNASQSAHDAAWAALGIRGDMPFASSPNPAMAMVDFIKTFVEPQAAADFALAAANVFVTRTAEARAAAAARGEEWASDGPSAAAVLAASQAEAMAAGLKAAAQRAHELADEAEGEMVRASVLACDMEARRVATKLAHVESIDVRAVRQEIETAKANTVKHVRDLARLVEKGDDAS
jgi:hypothetical protein